MAQGFTMQRQKRGRRGFARCAGAQRGVKRVLGPRTLSMAATCRRAGVLMADARLQTKIGDLASRSRGR